MDVKEFKRRWLNSKIEPELFYMPVGKKEDPFILKIEVFEDGGQAYIDIIGYINSLPYCTYKYTDMAVEYAVTGTVNTSDMGDLQGDLASKARLNGTRAYVVSDLVLSKPDDYLITDDIDYFRADADPYIKTTEKKLIFSKMVSEKSWGGKIDWGDGTIEDLTDLIKSYSDNGKSFKYMSGAKTHVYETAGEYTIRIYGHVPGIALNAYNYTYSSGNVNRWINALPKEIVSFGNLDMYCINGLIGGNSSDNEKFIEMLNNFKLPHHISAGTFRHVLSASNAFGYVKLDKSAFPEEFFTSFVSVFPNLIYANWMFGHTLIEEIPDNFCNEHDCLMNCNGMFGYSKVKRIGNYAFANCKKLTSVYDLTINANGAENCYLTTVGDYVFENDENLICMSNAFNYCTDPNIYKYPDKGLETVGDGIFKNCKRMRWAHEPFFQQSRLKTVGKDLFAGCEDLIDVNMCFYFCRSLKTIGEGIFRGCSKVRNFFDFFYMDFMVDYPDYMLFDVKYYDYLCSAKANYDISELGFNDISELGFNFRDFNYYTEMSYDDSYGSIIHLTECCAGFNKDDWTTFPTRKACEHMFSDEFINDAIASGKTLFNEETLHSLFTNEIYGPTKEYADENGSIVIQYIKFTPFTGKVFDITKYSGYESLFYHQNPSEPYGQDFGTYGVRSLICTIQNIDDNGNVTNTIEYKCFNLLSNYNEIVANCPWLAIGKQNDKGEVNYTVRSKFPALLHDWVTPMLPQQERILQIIDAPGTQIIYQN